jgi:hypothetical protein
MATKTTEPTRLKNWIEYLQDQIDHYLLDIARLKQQLEHLQHGDHDAMVRTRRLPPHQESLDANAPAPMGARR